jgi:hypothetical protein
LDTIALGNDKGTVFDIGVAAGCDIGCCTGCPLGAAIWAGDPVGNPIAGFVESGTAVCARGDALGEAGGTVFVGGETGCLLCERTLGTMEGSLVA